MLEKQKLLTISDNHSRDFSDSELFIYVQINLHSHLST